MIGFEIEISLPVTNQSGGVLKGDTKLAFSSPQGFTVVSDKRRTRQQTSYSNIEFVTEPESVVGASGTANGPKRLAAYVEHIAKVREALYAAGDATLAGAAGALLRPTTAGKTAYLAPSSTDYIEDADRKDGGDGLYVQYSIGVPLKAMASFFDFLRTNAPYRKDAYLAHARWRTNQAKDFAEDGVQKYLKAVGSAHKTVTAQLRGYLQLVYTQVAAMADYVGRDEDEGQIKNETVALCRSAFHEIFPLLDATVRDYLVKDFESDKQYLVGRIASYQERTENPNEKMPFSDNSSREINGVKVTLLDYAKSALTGDPEIDPQDVFGGMKEIVPDREEGVTVIPFEIRTLGGKYKTWAEVQGDLVLLTKWAQTAHRM